MSTAKRRSPWQFYNLAVFVIMVLMNILANALPINGLTTGEISDSLPNLFTPSGFTFAIWGVIYTLLALFAVFQTGLLPKTQRMALATAEAVGPWFVISSIANSLWIVAWHYEKIALTVPIMLIILISLIATYGRLRRMPSAPIARVAFSVYLGWISVATIANITGALVSVGWRALGMSHVTWTLIVIAVAGILGFLYLRLYQDIYFNMVIVWALFGILMQHVTLHGRSYWSIMGLAAGIMALLLYGIVNVIIDSREVLE